MKRGLSARHAHLEVDAADTVHHEDALGVPAEGGCTHGLLGLLPLLVMRVSGVLSEKGM